MLVDDDLVKPSRLLLADFLRRALGLSLSTLIVINPRSLRLMVGLVLLLSE